MRSIIPPFNSWFLFLVLPYIPIINSFSYHFKQTLHIISQTCRKWTHENTFTSRHEALIGCALFQPSANTEKCYWSFCLGYMLCANYIASDESCLFPNIFRQTNLNVSIDSLNTAKTACKWRVIVFPQIKNFLYHIAFMFAVKQQKNARPKSE